jgi:hypothetical protein
MNRFARAILLIITASLAGCLPSVFSSNLQGFWYSSSGDIYIEFVDQNMIIKSVDPTKNKLDADKQVLKFSKIDDNRYRVGMDADGASAILTIDKKTQELTTSLFDGEKFYKAVIATDRILSGNWFGNASLFNSRGKLIDSYSLGFWLDVDQILAEVTNQETLRKESANITWEILDGFIIKETRNTSANPRQAFLIITAVGEDYLDLVRSYKGTSIMRYELTRKDSRVVK